jgi:hypothetical protein
MQNDVGRVLKVSGFCMPIKKILHQKKTDANYMVPL